LPRVHFRLLSNAGSCPSAAVTRGARAARSRRRLPILVALLSGSLLVAGCARTGVDAALAPTFESGAGIPYTVSIEGLPHAEIGAELGATLQGALRVNTLADRPPPSMARLRRRTEADIETVARVLRSEGYFAAQVSARVSPPARASNPQLATKSGVEESDQARVERSRAAVRFSVSPGRRYTLRAFIVEAPGLAPDLMLPSASVLGAPVAGPARARSILAAEAASLDWLGEQGYPFAKRAARRTEVHREADVIVVTVTLDPGPCARFEGIVFEGPERVQPGYLRSYRPWQTGDWYRASDLRAFARALRETGLFERIKVAPDKVAAGRVPIRVQATETKHRSVGAGLRVSTDKGPEANAFVEHRNAFGRGELGRFELTAGLFRQQALATFRKPQFRQPGQALYASAGVGSEKDDAFDERAARIGIGIERAMTSSWRLRVGATAETATIRDRGRDKTSHLVGLPLGSRYDASDDALDPRRGYRWEAEVTPYAGTFDGEDVLFPVVDVAGSYYRPFGPHVFAARARVASILREARDSIPPPKRIYSGGAGSVRGYRIRHIGPLDADDNPVGGRSVLELGVELRLRVSKSLGLVPFVDAGMVGESSMPGESGRVHVATGLGVRYFTAIGPLRADIAVPVNPRDEDDDFQIYIAVGQAF